MIVCIDSSCIQQLSSNHIYDLKRDFESLQEHCKYHNEHFTFDIRYYCTLYILNRFFSTNSSKAEIMQSSQQTNDVSRKSMDVNNEAHG